ncbi:MAG: redoxin domain-containing protein [Candidatus Latescibacteria bacterium]|nr:redoxin domain-containing protein [Candidatus Latescibacterota bacterium]
MVELQSRVKNFEQNGIWICAISYDPVEVLGRFAAKQGITYPLLSDADSAVIRQFGILNTNVPPDHPWHGVPFPGTFMVDEKGRVIEKSFYADHAVRDSVGRMLQEVFQVQDAKRGVVQAFRTDSLKATAYLSAGTIRPGQVLTFTMEIEVKAGQHLHARPLPEGYIPTTLRFEEMEGVYFGEVVYPQPKPHRLETLGETLHVYGDRVVLKASVRSNRKEGFAVRAMLEYQSCDDQTCYLPDRIEFEIPLEVLDNVWD